MLSNGYESFNYSKRVQFISYTGEYPQLCQGVLTLLIDGKEYTFGHDYYKDIEGEFPRFWRSTGSIRFEKDYSGVNISRGEWCINVDDLPEELLPLAVDIDSEFNANVTWGCCGGCV